MDGADPLEDFLVCHERIPSSASIAPGAETSKWRIIAFLGRGGTAEVYRAVHKSLPLQAAMKILVRGDGSRRERFRREANLLSCLKSPVLPRIYDSGEVEGKPYMAMELLDPCELPRGDRAVAAFLTAVAGGVKALHDLGIVHRDLKPQNIMRRKDGSPVIIDLGLAKMTNASQCLPRPNTLSIVDGKQVGLGTLSYAAPEQFGGGEITPASDIHALGRLADECFGGRPPRTWRRIIERATSSIPALRYQSVDEFVRAIRRRNLWRNIGKAVLIMFLVGLLVDIVIVAVIIWLL